MQLRHRTLRPAVVAVVVALTLLGGAGVASAHKAGPSASKCIKHPTRAKCLNGGGSSGSSGGTGPSTGGPISIQIDPDPAVETGSTVAVIVQVETSAAFAGDPVDISSSQLVASCHDEAVESFVELPGSTATVDITTLDNDGNAQALVIGVSCAPGDSLVAADLAVAPFDTALGTLTVAAPVVTTAGVYGYPTTSGTVSGGEVEIGDSGDPVDDSSVLAVFEVETNPVYAEQTVEISSAQLQDRCGTGWALVPLSLELTPATGTLTAGDGSILGTTNATATTTLDDDGNAVFWFEGLSCAAGSSTVTADVEAGSHPTYTTTFTVLPPQVTT